MSPQNIALILHLKPFSQMFIPVAFVALAAGLVRAQQDAYGQCGGDNWSGDTTCVSGYYCEYLNSYYSQCVPGTASTTSAAATSTAVTPTSTSVSTTSKTATSTASASTSTSSGALPYLGGVNTAGYDFSVDTDGDFTGTGDVPPAWQYAHFADEGANIFRIPFAWQLMTPTLGGSINTTFFDTEYDVTVQAALATGAYVIVDLHNYARWNGGIIGQGGPTNAEYASIWTQLTSYYGNNTKVIFGLMNEPHDLDSIPDWADSLQYVVDAVREAGSINYLLLPGSSWSSAAELPTEAGPYLLNITDPLGGTDKLVFDVHQYLDSDDSGTSSTCVTNNTGVLQTLVTWLQENGNRQAILSETGGGSDSSSCETYLAEELAFIKENQASITGFSIWAAGAFDTTYTLSVTPDSDGTDQPLWTIAVEPYLP